MRRRTGISLLTTTAAAAAAAGVALLTGADPGQRSVDNQLLRDRLGLAKSRDVNEMTTCRDIDVTDALVNEGALINNEGSFGIIRACVSVVAGKTSETAWYPRVFGHATIEVVEPPSNSDQNLAVGIPSVKVSQDLASEEFTAKELKMAAEAFAVTGGGPLCIGDGDVSASAKFEVELSEGRDAVRIKLPRIDTEVATSPSEGLCR